jgi:V/A-type H+/Na+-transporting ATPase subunit I
MAIYNTRELSLTIHKDKLDHLLKDIIKSKLPIEFLNPSELGDEWKSLDLIKIDVLDDVEDLQTLAKMIKAFPDGGFWAAFEDTRAEYTTLELNEISKSRQDLIYVAKQILLANKNQSTIKSLSRNKKLLAKNAKEIKLLEAQINKTYDEIGIEKSEVKSLVIPEMKKLYSVIELDQKSRELPKYIFRTNKLSEVFFGFIAFPESKKAQVEKMLRLNDIPSKEIEWNKKLVVWETNNLEAFKQIPQALGVIDKKEVDPTIIVSFFFAFFFALAINDALYGLIIALFTGYVLYFRKIKTGLKNVFGLLFASGIFSVITGAFTGSWAGNLFEETPLHGLLSKFQLIKQIPTEKDLHLPLINEYLNEHFPGTSPVVALLAFAVVIGLVHIFTALILKAINAYKGRHYHHFITEISWVAFLMSGIVYLGAGSAPWKPILLLPLVIFLSLVFVFNSGKTILAKFTKGMIQLYELVSFLADILSYTRLIAIGLTGAIIADVINLLARLVYEASPNIIGAIFFIIVLIIGHLFNLVVGLFGAYINPLRLHYVEFLPKFYQGKARQLKGLDNNLTYGTVKI